MTPAPELRASATTAVLAAAAVGDGLDATVIFFGLAGVAAVAFIGTLVLVAGRRRRSRKITDRGRRSRMRGSAILADDPILSALGVDEAMAARREIRRAGRAREAPAQARESADRPRER